MAKAEEIAFYLISFVQTILHDEYAFEVGTHARDDNLKLECRYWEKNHFWTKSYHVTSAANDVGNWLIFICQLCMIYHHDTYKHIWKKRYGSYRNRKS